MAEGKNSLITLFDHTPTVKVIHNRFDYWAGKQMFDRAILPCASSWDKSGNCPAI